MDNKSILNLYQEHLLTRKLTEDSFKSRMTIILKFFNFLEEKSFAIQHIDSSLMVEFLGTLFYLKNSSYNVYLHSLRDFLIYLEDLKIINFTSALLKNKKIENNLPKNLPLDALHKLCKPHPNETLKTLLSLRNQALIEFLVSTGVRATECCNACIKDLSLDFSECFIRTVKKGEDRIVYLGEPAQLALRNYFEKRQVSIQNNGSEAIFAMKGGHMSYEALRRAVIKLSNFRLGYEVNPHSLRHSFATEMLRGCGCLASIQEMLGHKSMVNTAIYCHLDFKDAMQAVQQYHPLGEHFADEDFEKY